MNNLVLMKKVEEIKELVSDLEFWTKEFCKRDIITSCELIIEETEKLKAEVEDLIKEEMEILKEIEEEKRGVMYV